MNILVLNGPNLNLLGTRETSVYGGKTIDDLREEMTSSFPHVTFSFFQSNQEGVLIDRLHATNGDGTDAVIFNPGGYTHTSVALRDAVASIEAPVVEVHISNVAAREPFRHVSLIAPACTGQISGFGLQGYQIAVQALVLRESR
jgi:3-dehydroquinate dehydratase-2